MNYSGDDYVNLDEIEGCDAGYDMDYDQFDEDFDEFDDCEVRQVLAWLGVSTPIVH